jgi:uncharacterized protein
LAKAILLATVLQGAALPLAAQGDSLSRLFPARPTGYVTDVAGALEPGSVRRIAELAERLKNATGAEIATVVLPTIGAYAPVDVAVAIGRAWGVGARADIGDQRRNAGLVILLVPRRADDPNSGHIFIATGQGLEGIVTDYQAGRVRDLMRPAFQRGDYGGGLESGVGALAAMIARGMGVSDSALAAGALPEARPVRGVSSSRVVTMIIVVMLILLIAAASRSGGGRGGRRRRRRGGGIFWGGGGFGGFGGFGGGGFGGFGGGGGFGGFGGGGGFSGGGAGGRF